ncbi:hypothetical protein CAAN3_03S07470 [[Candida] anglica]
MYTTNRKTPSVRFQLSTKGAATKFSILSVVLVVIIILTFSIGKLGGAIDLIRQSTESSSYQVLDLGQPVAALSHNNPYSCDILHLKKNANSAEYCKYISKHCGVDYFALSKWYYCNGPSYSSLALVLTSVVSILLLLFLSLSILVANYLYPILVAVCRLLHVNDEFLSSVLVPFVNCFPDLVNYYITLKSDSVDLTLAQAMGSILIMFTLILGTICCMCPFDILDNRKILSNDFVWVFLVVLVFSYILSDGVITIYECTVMVGMYGAYVTYLFWTDKSIEEVQPTDLENQEEREHLLSPALIPISRNNSNLSIRVPFGIEDALSVLSDGFEEEDEEEIRVHDDLDNDEIVITSNPNGSNYDSMADLISFQANKMAAAHSTSELSLPSSIWVQTSTHKSIARSIFRNVTKMFQVIFNAIDLFLYTCIPFMVQEDEEDLTNAHERGEIVESRQVSNQHLSHHHRSVYINWRPYHESVDRYISYVRCIVIPTILIHEFFPDHTVSLFAIFPLSMIIVHWGHCQAPILIYTLAILMTLLITSMSGTLILQLLKNLGLMLRISESLLGLTIFSVSNSINDIITDVTLANIGRPILGVNACLGTPLLSILLGVGLNGLMLIISKSANGKQRLFEIPLDFNPHLKVTLCGLICILTFYLIYVPLNGWKFDRRLGILAIASWFVITTYNCTIVNW